MHRSFLIDQCRDAIQGLCQTRSGTPFLWLCRGGQGARISNQSLVVSQRKTTKYLFIVTSLVQRGQVTLVTAKNMKLGSIQKQDTTTLPKVPRSDVQLLWADDWYDGPLRGMASVDEAKYLFEMIDRDLLGAETEDRTYWLIRLSPDQLREEEQWHDLFCQHVGTHFDFTGRQGIPREQVQMDAFYKPYNERIVPDYSDNFVIGWFRL
jgi:hypothetical protein